jgi:hypothetical protein
VSENAVLLPLDGGERIENRLCGEIVFKARAAQTGGSLTVFEAVNRPGQRTHRPAHSYSSRAGAAHMGGARGRSRPLLVVVAPAGLESFFDSTAAAGGGQADDAFGRFSGDDLRVLGPPLAVSHPL